MSNNSNTVAIGAFIIGAVLIAISALIFIGGSGWGGDKSKIIMVFDGSVKGLSVGAPVALRGVEIGQITDIDLILDTTTIDLTMLVEAEIDGKNIETRGTAKNYLDDEMISRGLRAQLKSQSLLTGLLYVQLDFHPGSELNLADLDSEYSQIPTIPTDLQRLTRELDTFDFAGIAKNIESIALNLNAFVANEEFQRLPADLHNTLASLESLSEQIDVAVKVSGPKLENLLEDSASTMTTLNAEIPKISGAAMTTLKALNTTMAAFEQTMIDIDSLVSEDSSTTYALNKALREVYLAAKELHLLAKTLEANPQALLRGKSEDAQ